MCTCTCIPHIPLRWPNSGLVQSKGGAGIHARRGSRGVERAAHFPLLQEVAHSDRCHGSILPEHWRSAAARWLRQPHHLTQAPPGACRAAGPSPSNARRPLLRRLLPRRSASSQSGTFRNTTQHPQFIVLCHSALRASADPINPQTWNVVAAEENVCFSTVLGASYEEKLLLKCGSCASPTPMSRFHSVVYFRERK